MEKPMKKISLLFLLNFLFSAAIAQGQPVRIAYLQSDIHQLPCWVALEKGFFEKEGVKVEVAGIFKAGPELMSAFAAGAVDMGYVGVAPATTAVANKTARSRAFQNWWVRLRLFQGMPRFRIFSFVKRC